VTMDGRPVGFTTTIPVEVLLAAGRVPVDLNNIFISDPECAGLVSRAELEGYPRNCCGWIKGLYATVLDKGMDEIIAVTQGDCSQTHAMMETLQDSGVRVFPFAYPHNRDADLLREQIQRLIDRFGTSWQRAESVKEQLVPLRRQLAELDRLTWEENRVSGFDNHYYLVSATDFCSDVEGFAAEVAKVLHDSRSRTLQEGRARIGIIGVPPIITDFYDVLDRLGARVVFNEMQRQFSMIPYLDCGLLEQYQRYTYPYDVFARIEDINREVERRNIDGIIHYVQTFCFRQIQGMLIKRDVSVPVLEIEGDKPAPMDARNRLRVEAFMETLEARARGSAG